MIAPGTTAAVTGAPASGGYGAITGQITLSDPVITALGIAALVILTALSAFFSSSEIAMFSLARHRMDALATEGGRRGQVVARLRENPHRLLVTILVGNNIANIAMSAIATGLLGLYFTPAESVLVATFGITSLVLLFGESAPKAYAVGHAESWALRTARPLELTQYLLYPLVVLFDYLTRAVNSITGGHGGIETAYVTRSEILDIIETGEAQGVVEAGEADIIERVFQFATTTAKEVMVPRPDIAAVPATATLDEAIAIAIESRHHRMPVYDGNLDRILGIVSVIDLIEARDDHPTGNGTRQTLRTLASGRDPLAVPEGKPIDDLLAEMQRERYHMAVVVDEFGEFEGIVTTEDVTEALVGAILKRDEPVPVRLIAPGLASALGEVSIQEVNDALGIDLPTSDDYDTVAGLLMARLGRVPNPGETVVSDGVRITADRVEDTRILRVRLAWEPPRSEDVHS